MRKDGRSSSQMRPLRITPDFTKNATSSVLVEFGDTKVLCTVFAEDGVPSFLRGANPPQGWLTAEYSMLPSATLSRSKRERQSVGGRTQEIQRLIGRSLRGVVELTACPDVTLTIDCDVLQADGGTRTAAITGAYVALKMACDRLMRSGKIKRNPVTDGVAAVSIGIINGELYCDLNYVEDSTAELDMNVVVTHSGRFLEIQGTAERGSFSKEQVLGIMSLAEDALRPVFAAQNLAIDGQIAET
ncbi:MAG: ribonuclease PH [bacterium]|jgi:ribonuclease PH